VYEISFDPESRTLHLLLRGFWTMEVLTRFREDLRARIAELRASGEQFALLSDCRDFPVQSAEVAQGFEQLMVRGAQLHEGASAIVARSVLNKLQAERAFDGPRVRIFLDLEEARHWLRQQQDSPAA
jgi:hypothetical protein